MTLIIGVRCKDGCLVIADFRNQITDSNGKVTYEDNFEKVVEHNDYLIYNHGYNRIKDEDWKFRSQNLTPDDSNPIYENILNEMKLKPAKCAFYVFISKNMLYEIKIEVGKGVKGIDHLPEYRLVSGTGRKYVTDLKLLDDLKKKKCKKVQKSLKETFMKAYRNLSFSSNEEFSKGSKIYQLVN